MNGISNIPYRVVRSARRRTLSVQIDRGEVVVRAPVQLTDQSIAAWVEQKAEWIQPRLARQQADWHSKRISVQSGELPIFGESWRLLFFDRSNLTQSKAGYLCRDRNELVLPDRFRDHPEQAERAVKKLLRESAKHHLSMRLRDLSDNTGLHPSSVQVRQYRRRWGQCSSRKEITLNWRLIHLPMELQDYVILHELAHLREMNHSRAYWLALEKICPDAHRLNRELKQFSPYLDW